MFDFEDFAEKIVHSSDSGIEKDSNFDVLGHFLDDLAIFEDLQLQNNSHTIKVSAIL